MYFPTYGPGLDMCPSASLDMPALPTKDELGSLFRTELPAVLNSDGNQQFPFGRKYRTGQGAEDRPTAHRDAKQQKANKVSQQRYRERKKAKLHEMEAIIARMQEKLRHLQYLQQRNHVLESENEKLEARLVEVEREIEQLKFELDRQSDRSLQPQEETLSPSDALNALAGTSSGDCSAAIAGAAAAATVCCVPLAKDLSNVDFATCYEQRMEQLRQLVHDNALLEADPSGSGVDADVLRRVAGQVGRCCQLRQAAMSAEGTRSLALLASGSDWISGLDAREGRWDDVLQALKLSAAQQEQLLALRVEHLRKLRGVYTDRQDLSLQAMALMLPRHSPLLQQDNTIEGKLSHLSSKGYLSIAQSNLHLGNLLDAVKDTVRLEQRAVMSINSLAISRILTPIQAALFMVMSHPKLSDVLALINALARRTGTSQGGSPSDLCATSWSLPSQLPLLPSRQHSAQQGQQGGASGYSGGGEEEEQPRQHVTSHDSSFGRGRCGGVAGGGGGGDAGAGCLPTRSYSQGEGVILSGGFLMKSALDGGAVVGGDARGGCGRPQATTGSGAICGLG